MTGRRESRPVTRVGSIRALGGQLADLFEGFDGQGKVADRHDYDNRVERREAPYARAGKRPLARLRRADG
jgi:hypothetical protein